MIYMFYFCYMLPVIIKNRIKVKKTPAKTDQTMWKSLRYTIFRLANTSLHPVQLAPEPAIQSCDTGQPIPCFDSCQLSLIWMFIIKSNTDYRFPHSRKFDISFWFPSS